MSRALESARAGRVGEVGDLWLEEMSAGSIDGTQMAEVLRLLFDADSRDLAESLLELAIEELDAEGDERLPVLLRGAAPLFGKMEPLRRALVESLRDEHLMLQPLELFLARSGLSRKGTDVSQGWRAFGRLMTYRDGGFLHHGTFGTGEVRRVSRKSITVDFEKARNHDMMLEVALDTTVPLEPGSLMVMRWRDPDALAGLLRERPEELLGRLLEERGSESGQVTREDLEAVLPEGLEATSSWRSLRRAASSSSEYEDMGDRIVPALGSVPLPERVLGIVSDSGMSVSDMVLEVRALLRSAGAPAEPETGEALKAVESSRSPETGSLFELTELLGGRGERFLEPTAVRAARALGEIRSAPCRRRYLEVFLASGADRGEKLALTGLLKRRMWVVSMDLLRESDRELFRDAMKAAAESRSEVDRFLWSLEYRSGIPESGEGVRLPPVEGDPVELMLENLLFARAETQKRIASLLTGRLRRELETYLAGCDRRTLSTMRDNLEGSAPAQKGGLVLAVGRELAGRLESKSERGRKRHFWEGEALFDSREAIARRQADAEELRSVLIPRAADAIAEAASHGDLSENAEYAAAIERRDLLLDRLARWGEEMQRLRPYPEGEISDSVVSPGTGVVLSSEEGTRSLDIVGPLEASPEDGRVNYMAPLGAALLGRGPGDTVTLPDGGCWRVDEITVLEEVGER